MTRLMRLVLVATILGAAALASAQEQIDQPAPEGPKPPELAAAPIPVQIAAAKKVFIANLGGMPSRRYAYYSGPEERLYNQLYAALKSWGHYQLAASPNDA